MKPVRLLHSIFVALFPFKGKAHIALESLAIRAVVLSLAISLLLALPQFLPVLELFGEATQKVFSDPGALITLPFALFITIPFEFIFSMTFLISLLTVPFYLGFSFVYAQSSDIKIIINKTSLLFIGGASIFYLFIILNLWEGLLFYASF